jgi:hypothetical protein
MGVIRESDHSMKCYEISTSDASFLRFSPLLPTLRELHCA